MRLFFVGFIGVLCAAVGTLLAFLLGEMAAEAHHVSNFEGGRGYLLVFLVAPAGLLAGLAVGVVAALLLAKGGGLSFLKALGAGLAGTALLVGGVAGAFLLSAPRVPRLDGRALKLEFEIRLPAGKTLPDSLKEAGFTASLYSSSKDNRFTDVAFDRVGPREGRLVIPGSIELATQNGGRTLLAGVNFEESQVFHLPLAARPTPADEAWCDWLRADQYTRLTPALAPADAWELRYRVVRVEAAAAQ